MHYFEEITDQETLNAVSQIQDGIEQQTGTEPTFEEAFQIFRGEDILIAEEKYGSR